MKVESPRNGILILTDTFNRGWKAYEDGEARAIHRVNYKLRGIGISGGIHTIEFRYMPMSFILGVSITFSTVMLIIIYIFSQRKGRKKDVILVGKV